MWSTFFEETVNNSHKAASKGSRFQSLRLLFVKDTEMWNYDQKKTAFIVRNYE